MLQIISQIGARDKRLMGSENTFLVRSTNVKLLDYVRKQESTHPSVYSDAFLKQGISLILIIFTL